MWIFTEVADWFDKQRVDNNKFLDQTFQGWVDYAVKHEDEAGFWPALRNGMIYTGTGVLYALNQLTTTVASGFVDTLRIGDGVQKGGWGYAQDALRLIAIVGAAAKPLNALVQAGRVGLGSVVAVDIAPAQPICTWVASAKALAITGTRHFGTVESLSTTVFGAPSSPIQAVFLGDLLPAMQSMGASAREAGALTGPVEDTLTTLLKANPNSVAPFSVQWQLGANAANEFAQVGQGSAVGHTMVAYLDLLGNLRILDRTGKVAASLAEIESLVPAYSGISKAAFYALSDTALLVDQATIVPTLQNGATLATLIQAGATPLRTPDGTLVTDPQWIRQGIGLEMRSVPFRVETKRVVNVPVRVAHAKGQVKTQTVCMPTLGNSDAPPSAPTQSCTTLRTYVVQPGDTLAAIAVTAYNDANRWRGIAAVNGIKDPNTIQPGTTLIIP